MGFPSAQAAATRPKPIIPVPVAKWQNALVSPAQPESSPVLAATSHSAIAGGSVANWHQAPHLLLSAFQRRFPTRG
jgi:hypothetical protein